MLRTELKKLAISRLKDAEILLKSKRYSGAIYICGYAIELRLKNQICKKLKWADFPPGGSFGKYKSLKTHDLDVLLSFTGKEQKVKSSFLAEWSIVSQWNPEIRYNPISSVNKQDSLNMIASTQTLLTIL